MQTELSPQATEEATGGGGHPDRVEQNPRLAPVQVDHKGPLGWRTITFNPLLAIKPPWKEEHKPHLHSIQYSAPLLRVHVWPDAHLDTYDDKTALPEYSP